MQSDEILSLTSTAASVGDAVYAAWPVMYAEQPRPVQITGTCSVLRLKCDTCNMTVEQPDFGSGDQREKRARERAQWRCVSCNFWHRQGHRDMGFVQRQCSRCKKVVRAHILDGPRFASAAEWMCAPCLSPPMDIGVRYR